MNFTDNRNVRDPEHEDHDTTSPVMDPIENNEATSPAQSIDAEETEEAKTEVGENTSGLLIPEAQHLEPHVSNSLDSGRSFWLPFSELCLQLFWAGSSHPAIYLCLRSSLSRLASRRSHLLMTLVSFTSGITTTKAVPGP